MSFFRSPAALRTLSRRSPLTIRQSMRPISNSPAFRSSSGYGDMQGSPEAENPQEQGGSSVKKQNAEHPGPAPPAEGQGSGAGPTKGGSGDAQKTPADASAESGGSRSKEAKETGSSPTGGKVGGSGSGGKRHYSTQQRTEGSDQAQRRDETMEKARDAEKSKENTTPKIISDGDPAEGMSAEKKQEVEQHNKEFEERYDRAQPATDDKVDKKFWNGQDSPAKKSD